MTKKTIASPAVLVVGGTEAERAWTSNVVREIAPQAISATRLGEAKPVDELDLVVASYHGISGRDLRALLETSRREGAPAPRVLLTAWSNSECEPLFRELERYAVTNVLCVDPSASGNELRVTVQKLLGGDIFGLDRYLPDATDHATLRIGSSSDVVTAVDATVQFATARKIHPRLVENAATAVDELITNALYNAPVDANGVHRFAHLPRTEAVTLEPGQEIVLELACDGALLGVSVSDPFGTLTKAQTLEYMASGLRRQKREPHSGKGGAGIGLYITFGVLNHLVLNICLGARTEAIGLIDVRNTYRDFVERGKSFNVFFCPREGG